MKYPPPRVDNSWYSMEGCTTIVILYIYTESVDDEEGKEMKNEKKSEAQTWLDLRRWVVRSSV